MTFLKAAPTVLGLALLGLAFSPSARAKVDLPAPEQPRIAMRCMAGRIAQAANRRQAAAGSDR